MSQPKRCTALRSLVRNRMLVLCSIWKVPFSRISIEMTSPVGTRATKSRAACLYRVPPETTITSGGRAAAILRLINLPTLPTYPLDRLSRYEATLWRQACQILLTLQCLDRRKPWEKLRLR